MESPGVVERFCHAASVNSRPTRSVRDFAPERRNSSVTWFSTVTSAHPMAVAISLLV
jgi:hypothetical protein